MIKETAWRIPSFSRYCRGENLVILSVSPTPSHSLCKYYSVLNVTSSTMYLSPVETSD